MSSSFVTSTEEETTETYKSNLHLKPSARTLESMPESSLYSSKIEIKKEASLPVFIQQLSTLKAKIGDVVKLSVIISGFPKPKIQWLHNGNMLSSSETYTFVYDGNEYSCIIPYVNKDNEGEYTCMATNDHGETMCSSYLTVLSIEMTKQIDEKLELHEIADDKNTCFAPSFVKPIDTIRCDQNNEATFSYKVTGNPIPTVQWFNSKGQIMPGKCHTISHSEDGTGFLTVHKCQQEDSGSYSCKVFNSFGDASCTADLIVNQDLNPVIKEPHIKTTKSYKKSSVMETSETRLYAVNLSGDAWAKLQERDTMLYTIGIEGKYSAEREEVDTVHELQAVEQEQQAESVSKGKELIPLTAPVVSENVIEQHDKEIVSPVITELVGSQIQPLQVSVTEDITSTHKESELEDKRPKIENASVKSEEKTKYIAVTAEAIQIISCDTEQILHIHNVEFDEEQLLGQESPQLKEIDMSHLLTRAETGSLDPLVIPITDSLNTLMKEQEFTYTQSEDGKAICMKETFITSSSLSEERKQIPCDHASPILGREDGHIAECQTEQIQPINVQVVDSQGQLGSEEPFHFDILPEDQAELTKSPIPLLSSLSDERLPILCLDTGHIESVSAEIKLSFSQEQSPLLHLQTIQSELMLPKEDKLTFIDPGSYTAINKMEKSYNCCLTIEDKSLLSGESVQTLQTSPESVNPSSTLEGEQLKLANVVEDLVLLPKEDLLLSQKEQRGSLQKEDYQLVMQLCTTDESRTIDEGHDKTVPDTDMYACEVLNEPTFPLEIHCVENHGITTESVKLLDEAQQDYASGIQEGQSIRLPLVLEEKHAIQEENLKVVEKSDTENLIVEIQAKQPMAAPEVFDLETITKEELLISEHPKSFSLEIKSHVKSALNSALQTKPHIFSAEFLKYLDDIHVRNIKIIKESNYILCTCTVTANNFATEEISLSLPNIYPQRADLKTEINAALQAVICEKKQSLECEKLETLDSASDNLEMRQLDVLTEAGEFIQISAKETSSIVLVNTEIKDVGAAYYTDEVMSSTLKFQGQMEIVKKLEKPGEIYEEDTPLIKQSLIDIAADEGNSVTLQTTICNAKSVNWYFKGKLLSSGIEFNCSKNNDTYTLVISKVHMDLHQGEYTCEAMNDAGKSTTSATLTVVKRGWIMGIIEYHFSANFKKKYLIV